MYITLKSYALDYFKFRRSLDLYIKNGLFVTVYFKKNLKYIVNV
jgi:hypothetical protein